MTNTEVALQSKSNPESISPSLKNRVYTIIKVIMPPVGYSNNVDPEPSTSQKVGPDITKSATTIQLIPSTLNPIQKYVIKNDDLQTKFKFMYAVSRFKANCVFAKINNKTDYQCTYCPYLKLTDYDCFKKHIEKIHLKQSIAYSKCNICSESKSLDEFEFHIIKHHLQDKRLWFSLKLFCADETVGAENLEPRFTFKFEIDNEKNGHISVSAMTTNRFICGLCLIQFKKMSHLNTHISIKHMSMVNRVFCVSCGELIKCLSELQDHVLNQHSKSLKIVFDLQSIEPKPVVSKVKQMILEPRPIESRIVQTKPKNVVSGTIYKINAEPNANVKKIVKPTYPESSVFLNSQTRCFQTNYRKILPKTSYSESAIISKSNQPQSNIVVGEPNPKKTKTVDHSFELTYDIDSENDHCVIAKFNDASHSFSCTLCQIVYRELADLEDHIETSHIHDKISYSICEKCCTVLGSLHELTGHILTLHAQDSKTLCFQFKLISMKTTVLEDIEEGLTMRDMLTPSPTFENSDGMFKTLI